MSQCAGTFALLFLWKKTALFPCFCNILKANYIWLTLTRLTEHQKATRGHVCLFRKSEEMNEWMNGHYKVLHASGIIKTMTGKWISGFRQICCFVYFKCTRFLWKNKRIETGYTSHGAVNYYYFFKPRQRAAIGNEFKQNFLGKMKEWSMPSMSL